MQLDVFEVVSRPCTDDGSTLPHRNVRTNHKLCSGEKRVEWKTNMLKDLPYNLSIVNLLFHHSSCFSMSFKVIFQRNGKKGNKDVCRFEGFDLIVESMFLRLKYTGHSYWSPKRFVRCVWSELPNKRTIVAPSGRLS